MGRSSRTSARAPGLVIEIADHVTAPRPKFKYASHVAPEVVFFFVVALVKKKKGKEKA